MVKKIIARGLPPGLVKIIGRSLGEFGVPQSDADRAAALSRVLGWHITVTGGYQYDKPTPPKRKPKKRGKR